MRISMNLIAALAAVVWAVPALAQGPPIFDGRIVGAALAHDIADEAGDELLMWGECRGQDGSTVPGCLLFAVQDGVGFEVIAVLAEACDGGDCYGGYARSADVSVDDAKSADMEQIVQTHGGLGGTPLGMTAGTSDAGQPTLELRVRVHGGIATSPLGFVAGTPELRVKVYGGIATSPLGLQGGPHPAEIAAADLIAMVAAVID